MQRNQSFDQVTHQIHEAQSNSNKKKIKFLEKNKIKNPIKNLTQNANKTH